MNCRRSSFVIPLLVIVAVLAGLWAVRPTQLAQAAAGQSVAPHAPNAICETNYWGFVWHDASRWSCGHAPYITDDVIIRSGGNVTVQGGNYTARSVTIESGGYLWLGDGAYLEVATSIDRQVGSTFNPLANSWVGFNYGGPHTITGTATFDGVSIGAGNTLDLSASSNVSIASRLTVNATAMLDLGASTTNSVNGTVVNLGVIRAYRDIPAAGTYTFGAAGGPIGSSSLSLNVTTDNFDRIQVDRTDTNHPNATTPTETGHYWTITPTGSGTADLTLPVAFKPDSGDQVCDYTGSAWDCAPGSYNRANQTLTRSGITTFSDWTVSTSTPYTGLCTTNYSGFYWNDASRWTCNGILGAHVPTATDDVEVLVGGNVTTISDAVARSITVYPTANLWLGAATLTLSSDLEVQSGANFNMLAGSVFVFGGGHTQTLFGSAAFQNLSIGSGATLDLGTTGSVTVADTLTNNGVIRATRTIGAAGAYTFGLAGGPINTANVSLNVNTGHAFSSITVDRYDVNHPNRTGADAAKGVGWGNYWTITPVGTGTVDVTLPSTFVPTANDKVCRYTGTGTTWDCARTTDTSNTITRDGVTTFSDWATGNEVGPNAITLNTLDAKAAPDTSATGWLLALLGTFALGGLWLRRKAARD